MSGIAQTLAGHVRHLDICHSLSHSLTPLSPLSPPTAPKQTPLQQHDPDLYHIILKEKERQRHGLELIASENLTRSTSTCARPPPCPARHGEPTPCLEAHGVCH